MAKGFFKTGLSELRWQNFIALTIAGMINAIGVALFLAPVRLIDSGMSGTSMLVSMLTPEYLPLSFFLIVLNLPFYVIGMRKQGLTFTLYSVYAIGIYSLCAFLINDVIPLDVTVSSPFGGTDLVLCAVFGGIISGVGSGMTIRFGGAIDGIEVMAVLFAKHIGLTIGTFVMAYNTLLYIAAGFILHSWAIPLYSIVTYMAGLKAVDFVVEGFDKAKAAIVITDMREQMSKALSETLGRGVTILNAQGYYSGDDKAFIYCVVNRFQIGKLKRTVEQVDPRAFVTITEVADTFGQSVKLTKFKEIQK